MQLNVNVQELAKLSRHELIERAEAKAQLGVIQSRRECEASLVEFVRQAWHIVEPANPYVHGWHVDAIAMHLEAVNDGDIIRLLVNIPPGPGWVENLVTTSRGRVRLGDLTVGDMVLTHCGRYRPVTACYPKGILPTLRIVTQGGRETIATPDHNFLTPGGWIEAGSLRVGDALAFVTPIEDPFAAIVTPEEARLLGYLVGDGSMTHGTVGFTNKDDDVIADFEKCAAFMGFKTTKTRRKTHWFVRLNGGATVRDWLASHGLCGASSYTKFIPHAIISSNVFTIQNFIGAYWSCDGMFVVRPTRSRGSIYRASATTVSERLARDLQHALSRIGIRSSIRKKSRALETISQPGGVYRSFNVEIQKEADTARFINMPGLSVRKNKIVSACSRQRFDVVLNEDVIVSIEPAGDRECMCVSVDEDHSLVWDDIVVHNTMKSLLTSVFFPAWVWGPKGKPETRFLCTSYGLNLAIRDSLKMRRLVTSDWYRARWGKTVKITGDQSAKTKFENTATGFREAAAFESLTGSRGDIVILDDPHSVDSALSEAQRESTVTTFLEALPTRMNNPEKSAIIVIMQRLHEEDVSGVILEKGLPYTHLMLPQEFDPNRRCETDIGFVDPREEDGELLFPERFPRSVVERDKQVLGPYGYAGQFQQSPSPRGGGIVKREWWQLYDDEMAASQGAKDASRYPPMDYIIASLDGAYTTKQENDPSALTIWGVFQRGGSQARRILSRQGDVTEILDDRDTLPSVMLMTAWARRLPIHGPDIERNPGEDEFAYKMRQKAAWGLVEHVIDTCNRYKIDKLLIEAKGPGLSVAQEIKRLNRTTTWSVELVNPGASDKVARAHSVQPIFSSGAVYAPDKAWAEAVITEWEQFPRGKHDDLVDSTTQALKYLRERGMLGRPEEVAAEMRREAEYRPQQKIIYDV